jgi:hypothetical protein
VFKLVKVSAGAVVSTNTYNSETSKLIIVSSCEQRTLVRIEECPSVVLVLLPLCIVLKQERDLWESQFARLKNKFR